MKNGCNYIEAAKNVEDFDFREIESVELFNIFKDELKYVFKRVLKEDIGNTEHIKFMGVNFDCDKELDGKFYVTLLMPFQLRGSCFSMLSLKLTPFNARLIDERNPYWVCPEADRELTRFWQEFMSAIYGANWCGAYKRYDLKIKKDRDNRSLKNTEGVSSFVETVAVG